MLKDKLFFQAAGQNGGVVTPGELWSWGYSANYATGQNTTVDIQVPTQMGADTDWMKAAGFGDRASSGGFAIKADGTMWSWGDSAAYATGQGTLGNIQVPTQIGVDTDWLQVAGFGTQPGGGAGGGFAIKTDGTMWSWGNNANYSTGQSTAAGFTTTPTQMGTDTDWLQVAGFGDGTFSGGGGFAIKTDGTMWSWGDGAVYATGQGTTVDVQVPTQVGADTDWMQVAGFGGGGFAIKTDGTMWSWGYNARYSTGQNTLAGSTTTPTQMGTDTDWLQVAGGASGGFAIKADGTMWSWGASSFYATGQNTTVDIQVPTQVGADTDWSQVAGFNNGGFAIKTDGTMWSWGINANYSTGQNTAAGNTQVPTQMGADTDWMQVAGFGGGGFAIKS